MEPMRRPGDTPTGYERGIIKESALLSEPTIDSTLFGLTLHWNNKSVHEFVAVANSEHPVAASLPVWMTQPRGLLTEQGFKHDVMAYLAMSAGGLSRDNDLAPNTLLQHMCITKRFGHIEKEEFVQACMAMLDPGAYLAAIFVRCECPGFWIQPACFDPPPAPLRPVFY
ncbi:ATP-binding Cassette (ABC) Superfamily [Phytophthora cinnamomi]|uniref:ATP-binding Cassette (ABC) Superfamily n=1 Tax=Phytophthora cinnamomi TaxID=4785 RepID=UPI00355A6944|nr:ATP-binding Cassette (ABC) Superfamily [Phytophthora cinnamomi]